LLLLTGLRREEVGQLKWSEIENGTIHLEGNRTKTGAPHDVHLSAPARELLDSMRRFANCDWVFTPTGSRPLQSWSQAKARLDQECGVTDWRYHDLRRTVATGMEKLGIALPVTEAVLGHTGGSRGGIVKVYQRHQYQDEKRAALDLWAKHVAKLVGELT
jgi:integrase